MMLKEDFNQMVSMLMGKRHEKSGDICGQYSGKFMDYGRFEKNANNFHIHLFRQTRKQKGKGKY